MERDVVSMGNPKGCWRVCAGASLCLFSIAGLIINAFSVYMPFLQQSCGLTNTQTANYILVRSVFAFLAMLFVGKYYKKLDLRLGMMAAMLLAGSSLLLFGRARTYGGLCFAAIVGGIAYGFGGMYPASLLIDRWFRRHSALALGICAASTGLGSIIGAPAVTAAIARWSVHTVLTWEGLMIVGLALIAGLLIRNDPPGVQRQQADTPTGRLSIRLDWMFVAVVAIGATANTGYQFFSMLFSLRQFSAQQISLLASLAGVGVVASKFLFGEAVDEFGGFRSNWLFMGSTILGCVLLWLGHGFVSGLIGVILYGLGLAYSTVGLTVYAHDLNLPDAFSDAVRQYQTAFMLGSLIFGSVPGLIADRTGGYGLFYGLLAILGVFSLIVIQTRYKKRQRS